MQAFLEEDGATGLRRGELLGLKWQDIGWKNGIIKVRRQAARVDGQIAEAPLKRVPERAGIPKVRFHDRRRTFATIALQNGVDIKTVSGMLGHFSADFTQDTYAHVTTSAQKDAAQTMGNVLSL